MYALLAVKRLHWNATNTRCTFITADLIFSPVTAPHASAQPLSSSYFRAVDWGRRQTVFLNVPTANAGHVVTWGTLTYIEHSILDDVTGFIWGLLSLLTEMSTRSLPGGKERPARKADNLAARIDNVGASTSHSPVGLHILLQVYACLRFLH
jgi:hypothetical protein